MASDTTRRTFGAFSLRHDSAMAEQAYRSGLWGKQTLADALADAARATPDRVLLVDGETRLTAAMLAAQATALAGAMQARMAAGSTVSFMLPNWHEAAVVYLAATLAGMVANPILPSLRDHDLRFILADADTRMIFVPGSFRGHDYAAMLGRVAAGMADPPRSGGGARRRARALPHCSAKAHAFAPARAQCR